MIQHLLIAIGFLRTKDYNVAFFADFIIANQLPKCVCLSLDHQKTQNLTFGFLEAMFHVTTLIDI